MTGIRKLPKHRNIFRIYPCDESNSNELWRKGNRLCNGLEVEFNFKQAAAKAILMAKNSGANFIIHAHCEAFADNDGKTQVWVIYPKDNSFKCNMVNHND